MDRALKAVDRAPALSEQVYLALRDYLRNGAPTGQPLQEVQMAARLGVSRTPVREAMTRLASEGLLSSDGRSFTVPALTLADVDDIYELRFLIEPAAMRRVAGRSKDAALLAPISAALEDARSAHRLGDAAAFAEANVRYRAAWLGLVPNRRLVRTIELYAEHMHQIRALTLGRPRVRSIVLRGLQRITDALAAGNSDRAARAVHDHLVQARRAFIEATGLGCEAGRDPAAPRTPTHESEVMARSTGGSSTHAPAYAGMPGGTQTSPVPPDRAPKPPVSPLRAPKPTAARARAAGAVRTPTPNPSSAT